MGSSRGVLEGTTRLVATIETGGHRVMIREWERIRNRMQKLLSQGEYDLWFGTLKLVTSEDRRLVLGCRNRFHIEWIRSRFLERLLRVAKEELPWIEEIRFEVCADEDGEEVEGEKSEIQRQAPPARQVDFSHLQDKSISLFNPRFTFDQFVVGQSNQFAFAACQSLASQGSHIHSSVYLMAAPGLGKSHLTHAVGSRILEAQPEARVRYVTAEQFANEMIDALRKDRIHNFKKKYRDRCDVLLLEKVEFFSGKRKIQSEFVYTLDELLDRGCRLVCTGNRLPQEIPRLNGELRSRLGGILVAPINAPDFETRLEIVRRKARYDGVDIPDKIAEFLAERVTSDVRQLESCLVGLIVKSRVLGVPITLRLASEVTQSLLECLPNLGVEDIVDVVCVSFGVTREQLRSRSRSRHLSQARQMAMYLCREYTSESLPAIGRAFGRSHSTVIYSIRRLETALSRKNSPLKRQMDYMRRRIEYRCIRGK